MKLITPKRIFLQDWDNEPEVRLSKVEWNTLTAAYNILDRARDMAQQGDQDASTEFDTACLGLSELLFDAYDQLAKKETA